MQNITGPFAATSGATAPHVAVTAGPSMTGTFFAIEPFAN